MKKIRYGKEIVETTFYDYKPTEERRLEVRDVAANDSEELAFFIQLQQEHKGNTHLIFERKVTDKGVRYIIKSWRA